MIGSKHFQMGLAVSLLALMPQAAQAQTVEQLQAQIGDNGVSVLNGLCMRGALDTQGCIRLSLEAFLRCRMAQ